MHKAANWGTAKEPLEINLVLDIKIIIVIVTIIIKFTQSSSSSSSFSQRQLFSAFIASDGVGKKVFHSQWQPCPQLFSGTGGKMPECALARKNYAGRISQHKPNASNWQPMTITITMIITITIYRAIIRDRAPIAIWQTLPCTRQLSQIERQFSRVLDRKPLKCIQ